MKKRLLGRTGLNISELGLNTRRFGYSAEETASFAVLDAYYELGGRFIQGAAGCPPFDSTASQNTRAEELVGEWLHRRSIPRDEIVLGTRFDFSRPSVGGSIAFENLVRSCCEASLRRLRTTHLDLFICEWNETLTPVEDLIAAASLLVRAGRIRYLVAGGFRSWRVVDTLHRSVQRNLCRFEAVQEDYPLRSGLSPECESLSMCEEHRLGFIARPSPGGDLVATLARARKVSPTRVALAWTLNHPRVSSALFTATSARQVRGSIWASEAPLTDSDLCALNSAGVMQCPSVELSCA